MKSIARFFTLYWIIYFPTCIAYNDLPGFSSIDEIMMGILFVYTFMKYSNRSINRRPWMEFMVCLSVIAFYTLYSLMFGVNVAGGIWLDFMQEVRPYTIIFYMDFESEIYKKAKEMDACFHGSDFIFMDSLSSRIYRVC